MQMESQLSSNLPRSQPSLTSCTPSCVIRTQSKILRRSSETSTIRSSHGGSCERSPSSTLSTSLAGQRTPTRKRSPSYSMVTPRSKRVSCTTTRMGDSKISRFTSSSLHRLSLNTRQTHSLSRHSRQMHPLSRHSRQMG